MVDIISFVGILLSIIILVFKKHGRSDLIFLAGFYFTLSLIALSRNLVFLFHYSNSLRYFIPFVYPLLYCSGPFLYLYIKKSLADINDQQIKPHEYLYFLPILLVFINFSPQIFLSKADRDMFYSELSLNPMYIFNVKYLLFSLKINSILRPLYNLIFTVAGFVIILKNTYNDEKYKQKNISKNFIEALCFLYFFHSVLYILILWTLNRNNVSEFSKIDSSMQILMWLFSCLNLLMYLLSFLFPKVLYNFIYFDQSFDDQKTLDDQKMMSLSNPTFDGSDKLKHDFILIGEKLALYFSGKPFLQPGFTLSIIAHDTLIPYNQISLFYQVYLKINFNDWKNKVRIIHAKNLIDNGLANNLTLEAIALKCGYRSRSNFIAAFKKHTGKYPSHYVKDLPNERFIKSVDF